MMKRSVKLTLLCALLTAAAPAAAQEAGQTLSFDEAMHIAMTHNPALKAAAYEEKAASQERRAAIGLRLPKIGLTGAYAYMGKDIGVDINGLKQPVSDMAGSLIGSGMVPAELVPSLQGLLTPLMGADWAFTLQPRSLGFIGGEVTLPIYAGGKINVANRAARINEATVQAQGDQTRNALVSELVERYFGLALAMQVAEVREQVVAGVRKHLEDAQALEQNGMIARSERLYVEFKMSEAERELNNANLQVQTISQALDNTLGEVVSRQPVTAMFILSDLESADYYRQLAEKRNPLLNQVALKRRLAEEGVKLQRAEFMPQIAVVGGASFYEYQVTNLLPRWAVGVAVSFKLFDGLNREYKYSAAKQTVRRVDALEEKALRDVALLIEKLRNQIDNCARQVASIDASLTFAEEYLRSQQSGFLEGMVASSDLIDAELNLAKARTERLQAAYQYDLLLAQLLEAAGISDEFSAYARRDDARQILFDKK